MPGIDLSKLVTATDKAAAAALAAQGAERDRAAAFLAATDWYVVRLAETGKPVPSDVLAGRAAARITLSAPLPA